MSMHKVFVELKQGLDIIVASINHRLCKNGQFLLVALDRLGYELVFVWLKSQIFNVTYLLVALKIHLIFPNNLFDCLVFDLSLYVQGYILA